MPVTVAANQMSVVHKGSNGISVAFPDVCKTPAPPAPFVPIPYPNVSKSSDLSNGSGTVKADGQSIALKDSTFLISSGNEAGSLLGIASSKIKGKSEFVAVSMDVKVEGKGVARALDLMIHNDKNTPPFPVVQPPLPALRLLEDPVCLLCGEKMV